MAFYIKLGDN